MEPVYRGIELAAAGAARALGTRITYQGLENLPRDGGAVIAMNHISYIDYLPAGLAGRRRRRRIRYLLKAEMMQVGVVDWIRAHRMWTKDHPKCLGRKKIPITVRVGEPLQPNGTAAELDAALRRVMTADLHQVQEQYPHPVGAHWVPRRLGGGAPTPEEGGRRDEAELAERARRHAGRF